MTSWLHANGDRRVWPATWYAEGVQFPEPFLPLEGRVKADLCVVGAGITGLSAALHGAKAGMSVILLEAQRVGWGASGRNGGQVGSGFNWSQRKLAAKLGAQKARKLWNLAEEAKAMTRQVAAVRPGVLHTVYNKRQLQDIQAENDWMMSHYGTDARVLDGSEVADRIGSPAYAGGVLDMSAGVCNPLAYTLALVRACVATGVTIHEGSEVHRIDNKHVYTAKGAVTGRFVCHATNGYGAHLIGKSAARILPINNYIAVTEPLDVPPMRERMAVADSRFVVNYFWQTDDGRLVYGGGESYGRKFPDRARIEAKVRENLSRVYNDLSDVRFKHAWGGTLAVTATRLPYLAEVAPGVYSAGGYSGHGLALSSMSGKLCVEAMQGDRSRFDLMAGLPVPALPGGRMLGGWMAQAGMLWGATRDRFHG